MTNGSDLRSIAYNAIKKKILTGEYTTDEMLNTSSVARSLGMSRTPAREAMVRLSQEGLLREITNGGFMITQTTIKNANDLIDLLRCLEYFVIEEMERRNLLPDIGYLRENLQNQSEFISSGNFYDLYLSNCQFHIELIGTINNDEITDIYRKNIDKIVRIGFVSEKNKDKQLKVIDEHTAIVEALGDRDYEGAKKKVFDHYMNSKNRLVVR